MWVEFCEYATPITESVPHTAPLVARDQLLSNRAILRFKPGDRDGQRQTDVSDKNGRSEHNM